MVAVCGEAVFFLVSVYRVVVCGVSVYRLAVYRVVVCVVSVCKVGCLWSVCL